MDPTRLVMTLPRSIILLGFLILTFKENLR